MIVQTKTGSRVYGFHVFVAASCPMFYDIWHFLVKYIAPLAVLVILLQKAGFLSF